MNPREAGQRGGLATLERYGRAHFARITKGHPRRPRHGKEMLAGRSPRVVALSTTTRAKGGSAWRTDDTTGRNGVSLTPSVTRRPAESAPTNIIPFRPRAGHSAGPPMEGKVIPFG